MRCSNVQDEITSILYWLFEPEPYSEAHLYFDLATTVEEGLLGQSLLQHAASVIETALLLTLEFCYAIFPV